MIDRNKKMNDRDWKMNDRVLKINRKSLSKKAIEAQRRPVTVMQHLLYALSLF